MKLELNDSGCLDVDKLIEFVEWLAENNKELCKGGSLQDAVYKGAQWAFEAFADRLKDMKNNP